jgi:hypothetical protein
MNKFQVTGISTLDGKTKVRFANDLVSRVKILVKDGHADINLMELKEPLTKLECVRYLKTTDLYADFSEAIDAAEEKYAHAGTVKMSKSALSLDAIKARAGIVDDVDGVAVYAS